jgi:hypothetical protein
MPTLPAPDVVIEAGAKGLARPAASALITRRGAVHAARGTGSLRRSCGTTHSDAGMVEPMS